MPAGAVGAAEPSAASGANGARRGSGGKDNPNGAYRSEGPCRHNMFQILLILKVVFEDFPCFIIGNEV